MNYSVSSARQIDTAIGIQLTSLDGSSPIGPIDPIDPPPIEEGDPPDQRMKIWPNWLRISPIADKVFKLQFPIQYNSSAFIKI